MTEVKSYWGVAVPTRGDLRRFGLVLAALLALLGGYLWYVEAVGIAQLVHSASLVLLGIGLALPVALKPIYFPYMWLARIVAFVNIHLLLGLVFYTLFTLIGLGMRLLGRDPLDRKIAPDAESYWQRRAPSLFPRDHYHKRF
ncbi:MAG: SxtJ family membrane protein [Gemmatimonadota bacterium]|nr:SxtJ family membrane protein [Gemmatimonadota bacterium]MDE2742447.1 SxtJ family membrane protein [Gemmatimonadota bacterium]